MNECLIGLKPTLVWHYFGEISLIPRASRNEEEIIFYLIDFAKKHNLPFKKDEAGNILITKPASKGKTASPTIILQSHVDMVCEKESTSNHNFDKDPIELIFDKNDKDWIKANKTTLGADDGIGVALMLAILDDKNITHGPLECLFTVDEETGLNGAAGLEKNVLTGSMLINIDNSNDKEFCIGCAGGEDILIHLPIKTTISKKDTTAEIIISGLIGGHSGEDIKKNRANAIKLLARTIDEIIKKYELELVSIEGGSKRNAIPRDAKATICVSKKDIQKIKEIIEHMNHYINSDEEISDKNVLIELKELTNVNQIQNKQVLTKESFNATLHFLLSLPNGIIRMEKDLDDCVETSINLARVSIKENELTIEMLARSSKEKTLKSLVEDITEFAKKNDATISKDNYYPSWSPKPNTILLQKLKVVYVDSFKREPIVMSIHAGLETGIIKKKYPKMDLISIGPNTENLHSPSERLQISSVEKFYSFLLKGLDELSK